MITINRIGDSITGSINGKRFGVKFSQEKYDALLALEAKSNTVSTMVELEALYTDATVLATESFLETNAVPGCEYIHVNAATGKYFLKEKNKVSKVEMPKSFVDRILTSVEKGIDITPLIKFWVRLLRNPKLNAKKIRRICNYIAKTYVDREFRDELIKEQGVSTEVATERATSLQTPITMEGLLCTYKVSREITHRYVLEEVDGVQVKKKVDRYTPTKSINDVTGEVTVESDGKPAFVEDRIFEPAVVGQSNDAFECDGVLGHIIKVGAKHTLPEWSQVNCDDDITCVKGLHVGNLDYIAGYQNSGTETHYTFVDPMYIGAVTNDGSGALRVKEYYTYKSFAGVTKSIYHSSTYAAMTDADWARLRQEAIDAHKSNLLASSSEFEANLAD